MTNFAVISSDSFSHYAFYAPLTAAVWRARGYTPLLLLVGTEEAWQAESHQRVVLEHAREAGARVHFLGDFPGHRSATAAQVSRLFACALPGVEPDNYLLTSDVDMWPTGAWVGGGRDEVKEFQIWYANAYEGSGRVHFPMCYLGARARTWSKVMSGLLPVVGAAAAHQFAVLDDVARSPRTNIDFALALSGCRQSPDDPRNVHIVNDDKIPLSVWNFDEHYFGECLSAWPGYPDRCQFIPRDLRKDGQRRIDRAGWVDVAAASLPLYADAHLPRPGYTHEHWPRVRRLFEMAVPDKKGWAESYWQALFGGRR